jgi:hypothetical protein
MCTFDEMSVLICLNDVTKRKDENKPYISLSRRSSEALRDVEDVNLKALPSAEIYSMKQT